MPPTYVSVNWVNIGWGYGLSPVRYQAIAWNNADLTLIEPFWTKSTAVGIKIQNFSVMKMHLKILCMKLRPFCRCQIWRVLFFDDFFQFNSIQFQFRLLTHNTKVSQQQPQTQFTQATERHSVDTVHSRYITVNFLQNLTKDTKKSGLYVEVRGANYEFIHELKKVIVFSLSNCVQYRFHLTAMYWESVAPVKQWNRFTVKSVHTHKKHESNAFQKCINKRF